MRPGPCLITGGSGFIGRFFLNRYPAEAMGTFLSTPQPGLVRVDLTDAEGVRLTLDGLQPRAIIHCAARPNVDWCEANPTLARRLNFTPAEILAAECAARGIPMAFLSTDYVFDGASGPYTENMAPNPINVYGRLKLEAEGAIRARLAEHVIVRTTNVYGYDRLSRNFLMGILPRLARGEEVTLAADQLGTPTTVDDLVRGCWGLLHDGRWGTWHITGPDVVDRVEWAMRAASVFGIERPRIVGLLTAALQQAAPRPLRAGLVAERAAAVLPFRILGLDEGLEWMRAEWGGAPAVARW